MLSLLTQSGLDAEAAANVQARLRDPSLPFVSPEGVVTHSTELGADVSGETCHHFSCAPLSMAETLTVMSLKGLLVMSSSVYSAAS